MLRKTSQAPKDKYGIIITHVESIKVYLIEIKGRMVFTRDKEK